MEAFFSSLVGGEGLRNMVLDCLRDALLADLSRRVDIHIMTFSFTDERVASLLKEAATRHPNLTIRMVADWGQGSRLAGRQVQGLARSALPNLLVRYKHDQPYVWDAASDAPRWSYRASRGLLHHKTVGIHVDGAPCKLVCGSFNWTAKAADSYENLLLVTPDDAESIRLMHCVEREFQAMWCDGRVTLSPDEARLHYRAILEEYRRDPQKDPSAVVGLAVGRGGTLPPGVSVDVDSPAPDAADRPDETRVEIAFSSRARHEPNGERGYSPRNRARRFRLRKPSGTLKEVPLTLTALALDMIGRPTAGHTLKAAMYALSLRVPEYGALLAAARRGVRLQVLLDANAAAHVVAQLRLVRERERLPIEIRVGHRTMHQKYIVHVQTHTVLTGTANFSTDASVRHSEHRILIRDEPAIAARFVADFDTIWSRLAKAL